VEQAGSAHAESYQLFLVDRLTDQARIDGLEREIRRILVDVLAATSDYPAMRERCARLQENLAGRLDSAGSPQLPESPSRIREYIEFLNWLEADNFIFLGYREYEVVESGGVRFARVVPDSGLGILRDHTLSSFSRPVPVEDLPEEVRKQMAGPPVLLVAKANTESEIHRAALLDYIGVKEFDGAAQLIGERRFLGLFTSRAYSAPIEEIPILRQKLKKVLEIDRAPVGSHDYKQIVNVFNSIPLGELFLLEPDDLQRNIRDIMSVERERGVRLQIRVDPLKRGLIVMVIMPRERFNSDVRSRIQNYLAGQLQARQVEYHLAMTDEDDNQARFHFFFATTIRSDQIDQLLLEREVTALTRTWDDRLEEVFSQAEGEAGLQLADRYCRFLSDGYKAEVPIEDAVRDVRNIESLGEQPFVVDLVNPDTARDPERTTYLRLYHTRELALNEIFPILENLGLQVFEQIFYRLRLTDSSAASIDIFRVQDPKGARVDPDLDGRRLKESLLAVLTRGARNDRLNRLVLSAGLTIREIALLSAYRGYLFQVAPATSLTFITDTLLAYPECAGRLVNFFRERFSPGPEPEREARVERAREDALSSLNQVSTLPEDEILRFLIVLVEATVRTNFYLSQPHISLKIHSRQLERIPEPKPFFEIFVSSPALEGIHLRGGRIARGGIRWSDRPDDFRTEVLGLMKTQMTKNALIVPEGSKGGFVLKAPPADRTLLKEHVREQYRTFIRGLLDLTDNIVEGTTVHPKDLVVYDDFDPYLVVAADKGTATFSDLANEVSNEYGFWLGDAFASGGSHGYDHKEEGITAKGAWECVGRHFRELGLDPHRDTFAVAGIGDMSGDVFGNGMIYSDRIRLLAAFNHLHIFIDPNPDPAVSFEERLRLFANPSLTWMDYDRDRLSPGAGIFPRFAKSIPLSPEIRELIETTSEQMSSAELVRSILRLRVDLLWNGGIGTYVKARNQRHSDVGDPQNDGVRIDASELRARVVGEGGNLGLTQPARIEYALLGGRINTDAIDNSGGVDMSDHEVNIKILLNSQMSRGHLSFDARNRILSEMTSEVSRLVLSNNYRQALCLSLAQRSANRDWEGFAALQRFLTTQGLLKPAVEFLPEPEELILRNRSSQSYTRPELSVLLAYTKMALKRALLESSLPDEAALEQYLYNYFPAQIRERMRAGIQTHPLRSEIIATRITNLVVDRLGIDFLFGVIESTESEPAEAVRATVAAHEILDLPGFVEQITNLDDQLKPDDQYDSLNDLTVAVRGIVHWLLLGAEQKEDFTALIETYRAPLKQLIQGLEQLLPSKTEKRRFQTRKQRAIAAGFSEEFASELAAADYAASGMGVVDIVIATGTPLDQAARRFYALGELFSLGWLRDELRPVRSADRWDSVARGGLTADLRHVQRQLTILHLRENGEQEVSVQAFLKREKRLVERITQTIRKMKEQRKVDLAGGMVVGRLLMQLLENLERGG
jgi:glutamate dehydrogenase